MHVMRPAERTHHRLRSVCDRLSSFVLRIAPAVGTLPIGVPTPHVLRALVLTPILCGVRSKVIPKGGSGGVLLCIHVDSVHGAGSARCNESTNHRSQCCRAGIVEHVHEVAAQLNVTAPGMHTALTRVEQKRGIQAHPWHTRTRRAISQEQSRTGSNCSSGYVVGAIGLEPMTSCV